MKVRNLQFKRAVSAVLFFLLLSAVGMTKAFAQTFTVDDLNYTINDDGVSVTVTGHVDGTAATGELVIPESITQWGNTYLVTAIGDYAFSGCSGLTGAVVIPNSVVTIQSYAFNACSGLTSIIIGNSVTSINYSAFQSCHGLTSITIPASVTFISCGAFNDCNNLSLLEYNAINCGMSWNCWSDHWLSHCPSLCSIIIGNDVQVIPNSFVSGLSGLTSVFIGNSVTSIGNSAFRNCSNLSGELIIPNSVISIGDNAFENCSGYSQITIGNNVNHIGNNAFNGCSGFTGSLTIPNAVTTIGSSAFMNCTGFSGILTFGQSLSMINNSAFFGSCEGFTSINVLAEVPPTLGNNVFISIDYSIPMQVPCGSLSAYQNAGGWSSFTNIHEQNPCMWDITATANPTTGGMVSGTGTYEQGQTCTLTATPAEGYEFLNWRENDAIVSTETTYSFTVTSNRNLVANFSLEGLCDIVFNLYDSFGDGWNGNKLIVSANDDADYSFYEELTINYGSSATYTLSILDGSHITLSWIADIYIEECSFNVQFASNGYLIYQGTNLNGTSYEFDLHCDDAYTFVITTVGNPVEGGSISGSGRYLEGETCTLTATPNEDYAFVRWTENGEVVSTDASYSFTVTGDRNLVANFRNIRYNVWVAVQPEEGGTVSANNKSTDRDGWVYYDNGINYGGFGTSSFYWGIMFPSGSYSGKCVTKVSMYDYTAHTGNIMVYQGGIMAPETLLYMQPYTCSGVQDFVEWEFTRPVIIDPMQNLWIVMHNDNGNYVASICDNNGDANGRWVCFDGTDWHDEYGYNFTFMLRAYVSNFELIGDYLEGETCTLTATPNEDYAFVSWTENNEEVSTDASYSFTVTGDRNLVANFRYLRYEITAIAIPEAGGTISGSGSYLEGQTCTLTATPNEDYSFVRWTENGEVVSTDASYSFTVTGDRNLVAKFTSTNFIVFADPNVEAICVANWDTDGDGVLSYDEAAAVTDLGEAFRYNTDITSFDELQYFTGLTSIGYQAFYNCSNLVSIILPESITLINGYAFCNCSSLTGDLVIPNSVTEIEYCAFEYCSGYNGTLTIGTDVNYIGFWVFDDTNFTTLNYNATNCSVSSAWLSNDYSNYSLTNLTIGDNVQVIPDYAFSYLPNITGDLVIPNSVTLIGSSAFRSCSGLTSVTIGNSVISIGNNAFMNCSGLTMITLPDSVTDIGSSAFYNCSGLTSITIPELVTSIEGTVFGNCYNLATLNFNATNCPWVAASWLDECFSLSNVIIGENVQVIPDNFVSNCTWLTSIILPESVISIGIYAFYGCYGLTGNFVIPNNVVSIGDHAFYNCYGLEGIVMGNSVETIGSEAFYNCSGLRGELTLPESLQSVGPSAFAGCNEISTVNYNAINCTEMGNVSQNVFADCLSLTHIHIGANVESIPNYAFKPCFLVTDMSVAAEVPPTIYSSTFGTVSRNIPVSVPYGSGEAYRTAQYWEEFFHITEDYSPNSYTYHWNVNVHQFADNMTVTGIIQIEGVEQAVPYLEIGAFCNGECRGRQLLTYYPQVDRYLVFLMLYGEDGDMFSFKLYDHEAGEELTAGCASVLTFEADAIVGSFLDPYVFNFSDMQLTQFSEGWNWWSTYVEQAGIDGLSQLEESLGDNGITIRSQVGYTDYYAGYGWYGSLSSINNESSYKIKTSASCVAAMAGGTAIPSQHPITLNQGWTWMGYLPSFALDINTALDGLDATQGDKVKSQQGYSDYYPGYGWFGSLNTIEPGMGLMYYSANSDAVTFTYPDNTRGGELKANLIAENNHWKPNVYAYPDNMTVMAVVELDDEELNTENYELAAFAANGECRGSVKLTYAEPLHRYVAFLTISGKDAIELSFRLYNTETNEEYYNAEESLDFVANAMVGKSDALYVVHFKGIMGMDEFANEVKVYPNPVNAGERFNIGLSGDVTDIVRVEIINTLGMVETVCTSSRQTLTAPKVAGVYMLRITVEGKETVVRKLVVK